MNDRCDFCPRPGRLATCRCPNGHAGVGVWVCAEKHGPWLNSVEIACRQCEAGQPSRIVALYETASAALVAEVERLRVELERLQDIEDRYQQLGGALTAAWPGISAMLAITWVAIEKSLPEYDQRTETDR